MKLNRSTLVAALAGATIALPALAQTDPARPRTQPPSSTPPPRVIDRDKEIEDRDLDKLKDDQARRMPMLVPAERLIGADVVTSAGDDLGDINDLLIATKPGRVKYMVLSRGGVAGLGDTLYAVPFPAFNWDQTRESFLLPTTEEQIKNAPKIEGTDWKVLSTEDRDRQLNQYYQVNDDDLETFTKHDDRDFGRRRDEAALQRWPILRATDVRGQTLMSDEGTELGTIDDIVVDRSSGRIAFAVVSFGGLLGMGDNLVAVPWDLFDVNSEGKVFATKIDKAKIQSAPRLEDDDLDQLEDMTFVQTQYKHFGQDAQWLSSMRAGGDGMDHDRMGGDAHQRHWTGGRPDDLQGTVTNVTTSTEPNMPRIVVLSVDADDKRNIPVHVAPESFLREKGINLKPGDKVTLHGRWCDVEGKECFLVGTITPASGQRIDIRKDDGTGYWK